MRRDQVIQFIHFINKRPSYPGTGSIWCAAFSVVYDRDSRPTIGVHNTPHPTGHFGPTSY